MELIQYNVIYNKKISGFDILFKKNSEFYENELLDKILQSNNIHKTEKGLYFASIEECYISNEEFQKILESIESVSDIIFELNKNIQLEETHKTNMYLISDEKNLVHIVEKESFEKNDSYTNNLKLDTILLEIFPKIDFINDKYSFKNYVNDKNELLKLLKNVPYFLFENK